MLFLVALDPCGSVSIPHGCRCRATWRQHAAAPRLGWLANEHVLASFLRCRLFDNVHDRVIGARKVVVRRPSRLMHRGIDRGASRPHQARRPPVVASGEGYQNSLRTSRRAAAGRHLFIEGAHPNRLSSCINDGAHFVHELGLVCHEA